jgi:glycosyltransferase involved in cell wall biosynthesis
LNRFQICNIPPGIDTEIYKPLDREMCRSLLGIPQDRKVLFFMAASLNDKIKGADLLVKALQSLPKSLRAEIILLVAGKGGEHIATFDDIQMINLGYIIGDRFKAIAYSAADLFIHPTRADVAPMVLIESMACGTPIVSFRIGGVPDSVRPGITGYLAEPENAESLRNHMVELLEDSSQRNYMGQQCRAIAQKEYSFDLHVQRHIDLYRRLLQN